MRLLARQVERRISTSRMWLRMASSGGGKQVRSRFKARSQICVRQMKKAPTVRGGLVKDWIRAEIAYFAEVFSIDPGSFTLSLRSSCATLRGRPGFQLLGGGGGGGTHGGSHTGTQTRTWRQIL